jgi:putative GTP pyrophosphokinase
MADYERHSELLEDLRPRLKDLIEQLLRDAGVRVHSVDCRVKETDSLHRKLHRTPGKYQSLVEVADCLGVRVITHFADEVDAVAQMIEREFEINREDSVDRRATMDPDRFGYVSLHYVASLPRGRTNLTEYKWSAP